MLEPNDIVKGLRVFHMTHGLGKITVVNAIPGYCSVQFDEGIYWGGVSTMKLVEQLFKSEAWEKHKMSMEDERRGKLLEQRIEHQLKILSNNEIENKTLISPGSPSEDDTLLAEGWLKGRDKPSEAYEAMMLSARMAERAVVSYFEKQVGAVEDVSLQQLTNPKSGDWKLFDIRVGKLSLDVKNARRSEQNPKAYVSHCVPKFKLNRSGDEVCIAGALSDWMTKDRIVRGDSNVRYLGTVTETHIENLREMLKGGSLGFSVSSIHSPTFLPSWIFDYSIEDYGDVRASALLDLEQCLQSPDLKFLHIKPSIIPAIIAAGISPIPPSLVPAGSWQAAFADELKRRSNGFGLSLPVLFLTILEHFVKMLKEGAPDDYEPACYRPLVVPSGDWDNFPLTIFDPECAVSTLIDSLAVLWNHRNGALREIRYFTLKELNILSGKKDKNSPNLTILAYCGGWIESADSSKPCGKAPLVFGDGECESCSECYRLICPTCDYCSENCPDRAKRRSAKQQEAKIS